MRMRNDGAQNCAECEFMKEYNYGRKLYCCDHVDRTDDIGKLSMDNPPEGSPEWCPVRDK